MKLFVLAYHFDGFCCKSCCDEEASMTATWREKPDTYECAYCGEKTEEWPIEHGNMTPPEATRNATNDEVRSLGWRCDGDTQCESCDLYEFDGQYPVCVDCNQCTECGHADGCQSQ